MRIISRKTLKEFWDRHPNSEQQLKTWFKEVKNAEWENVNIIKTAYPALSILNGNRFVFNIKGNHYRLIVKINFDYQIVWIRFIGTHSEYDKIDANKI
jgi:mRNA interferase HigB